MLATSKSIQEVSTFGDAEEKRAGDFVVILLERWFVRGLEMKVRKKGVLAASGNIQRKSRWLGDAWMLVFGNRQDDGSLSDCVLGC